MREVDLPFGSSPEDISSAFRTIEQASRENAFAIADGYSLSNVSATRTLDPSTATLSDVAAVLATLLDDLQRRGSTRTE